MKIYKLNVMWLDETEDERIFAKIDDVYKEIIRLIEANYLIYKVKIIELDDYGIGGELIETETIYEHEINMKKSDE